MLAITVTHNDVEFALRLLKRQLQKSGLLRELRRRRHGVGHVTVDTCGKPDLPTLLAWNEAWYEAALKLWRV